MPLHPTSYEWLISAIKFHQSDECLIWPFSKGSNGYGQIRYRKHTIRCHRLVFRLIHGRWPTPCARHTCDKPPCINPRHIIEGTQADNIEDKCKRNRQLKGEKIPNAALTDDVIDKIRSEYIAYDKRHGGTPLALRYGVSESTISEIVNRKRWKHIQ